MLKLRPKAILLDLDNTVYAYAPCHAKGMANVFKKAKRIHSDWKNLAKFESAFEEARDTVKSRIKGQPSEHCRLLYFQTLVEHVLGRTDVAKAMELDALYWAGYFSALVPDPDVKLTIKKWRARGVKLAWVTNFTVEWQMKKLTKLGLENALHYLVTSEEAGAQKPHPAPFGLALAKLQVEAKQTCFIGDDIEHDILPAQELGMTAVWLRRTARVKLPKRLESIARVAKNWRQIAEAFSFSGAA